MTWKITSAGSKAVLLVIASRGPLENLERDIESIPRAEQGRQIVYAQVSKATIKGLRGMGGMAPADSIPGNGAGDQLTGILQDLPTAAGTASDIWTWQIELENPGSY